MIYSGTVAAAIAGSIGGVKSAAFSSSSIFSSENISEDFKMYFNKAMEITINTLKIENTVLNFNIPLDNIKGIKVTPMAIFSYNTILLKQEDSNNHYMIAGDHDYKSDKDHDNDMEHFKNGFMTITPIQYDFTNYSYIGELKSKYETKRAINEG